jgi:putative hydrolase of the HAD superfamily
VFRGAPVRGVLFDLFHTLTGVESESDLPPTCAVLGIERRVWDEQLVLRSRWRLCGEERDPERIIRTLVNEIDPSIPDEVVRRAVDHRVRRFRQTLERVPAKNVEALKRLRAAGFRLGLVSNADAMEVAAWLDTPLAGLFDAEVFSCHAGCAKPDPEIFQRCLDALGLPASECVFAGDGGSNELEAARALGMKTIFVSGVLEDLWPDRVPARRALADHHVTWAYEVPALLGLEPIPV